MHAMENTPSRWIAYRKSLSDVRLRLFCFHFAGGGASVFRSWQQELPAGVEVCPVQLPGRESRLREAPFERLAPILEALQPELEPLLDRPFAFFGHSMGSVVSFELALKLRRERGVSPLHLFLSGRRAPHRPDPDPPIHDLPEDEFKEELRELNGTPEEVLAHPELMELLLPVLRADFAVCETYVHQPAEPLACPVSICGGLADEKVKREDLEAWQQYSRGSFKVRMFPGDHFYLLGTARSDLIQCVAQDLQPTLARLEGRYV